MREDKQNIEKNLRSALQNEIKDLNPAFVDDVLAKYLAEINLDQSIELDFIPNAENDIKKLLFNNYSVFYRNNLGLAVLENHVLPSLIERRAKEGSKELRIWSAACAEGQEPYTLAMLLEEQTLIRSKKFDYRIIATDLQEDNLKFAKAGVYGYEAICNLSVSRFNRWFKPSGNGFMVSEHLKSRVVFQIFDLLSMNQQSPSEGIFGTYDLIFCSNILIYYHTEAQKEILKKLENSLVPRGVLVVGEAERALVRTDLFQEIIPLSGIFQKRIMPYFS